MNHFEEGYPSTEILIDASGFKPSAYEKVKVKVKICDQLCQPKFEKATYLKISLGGD